MNPTLVTSLWITLLGMGLVFAALILLAGLMSALTRLFRDKDTALRHSLRSQDTASDSPAAAPASDADDLARAAAAAVAVALSAQGQSSARPLSLPPTTIVGAWQLGMRTRHMTQKGELGRRGK